MKALTTLLVIGMSATAVVLADDADDVKAAEMDFRAKESSGNVEGYFAHKAPTYTIFPPTSGLLSEGQDIERWCPTRYANPEHRRTTLWEHSSEHLLPDVHHPTARW